jgi:predicted phosphatase
MTGTAQIPVLYLAGSGHTGSTLLAMFMDAHPEIASVGEIAVKPPIRRRGDAGLQRCSCGAAVRLCPFWRGVFERIRAEGVAFGLDAWTNDYRYEHPYLHRILSRGSGRAWVRAMQLSAAEWLPVHRARVARVDRANAVFMRAVLAQSGARVFFDASKQPLRLAHLLRVAALDVRVVRLVRDVRAYVASAKRRGISVSDAAHTWEADQRAITDIVGRRLDPSRHMVLRYEDLCRTPAAALSLLYAFAGVSAVQPPQTIRSRDHHVLGNNMRLGADISIRLDQSWKAALRPEEERDVLRIAGAGNRAFGYLADTVTQ